MYNHKRGNMAMKQGDRVWAGKHLVLGTVNYIRVRGSVVEAVSVIRDDRAKRPGYAGTLYGAAEVQLAPQGYHNCCCRDCFETVCGEDPFCDGCREAGCADYFGHEGMSQECQRPDAYGVEG